jgi:nitrogen PTS system EIIA component
MIAKDLNLDADVITELLLEREALQPTSLNHGIGIPHTRDFLLNEHQDVVTIAFPEKPIAYGALDGKPVDTLFFLFACDDKRHLHLLAKIAHLSSHAHTLELLQSKPSKEKLLEYVKNWESQIQQI